MRLRDIFADLFGVILLFALAYGTLFLGAILSPV